MLVNCKVLSISNRCQTQILLSHCLHLHVKLQLPTVIMCLLVYRINILSLNYWYIINLQPSA